MQPMITTRQNVVPPPIAQAPKRMRLDAVTRGRIDCPMRILLAGTAGIGKSTFASCAPSPIFLGAEDGTAQLDVTRLPEPKTWDDALDAVQLLTVEDHPYRTFVVDTLDWLEPLVFARVCADAGKKQIEDLNYGRGYVAALDIWRVFLARLDAMRAKRGMHIILLAHSWIKLFKSPTSDDYDRYELKLHAKSSGLLKEWSDCVLFAQYETFAVEKNGRVRGVSAGARLIHTEQTAAWDAKNRYGLPPSLPLSWDDFDAAVKAGAPASIEALDMEISSLMTKVDADTRTKAEAWLKSSGARAPRQLAQLADRLRGKVQINQTEKAE